VVADFASSLVVAKKMVIIAILHYPEWEWFMWALGLNGSGLIPGEPSLRNISVRQK
jgi:hypothetical protein